MTKALTPAQALNKDLDTMTPQFKKALPNHISVDKFVRTIQTAISTSPDIASATKQSLFGAAMHAAKDGLLPDGKEAAIVTFKNKNGERIANYMPMVGGILKKVRNSGELGSITSQVVYQNDEFDFYVDEDGEHLKHKPNMFGDRGDVIGVYALAKTKDGAVYIEVMSKDEVMAVKNVSRGKNGPWAGAFSLEMWRKTAIKRLAKRLPMSTDLEHTIAADDDMYDVKNEEPVEPKEKEVKSTTTPSKLNQLIKEDEVIDAKSEIPEDEVPI